MVTCSPLTWRTLCEIKLKKHFTFNNKIMSLLHEFLKQQLKYNSQIRLIVENLITKVFSNVDNFDII